MRENRTEAAIVQRDLYFGCWGRTGHGFHYADGRSATYRSDPPTPWGYGVENLTPTTTKEQGAASLTCAGGWTALAVHDYTVDRRPGSKSVFCFPAILTFEEAVKQAAYSFPGIVKRIGPITLAPDDNGRSEP